MNRTEEALNRSRAKRSEFIDQLGNGGVSDREVLGHIETIERDIERLRGELAAEQAEPTDEDLGITEEERDHHRYMEDDILCYDESTNPSNGWRCPSDEEL